MTRWSDPVGSGETASLSRVDRGAGSREAERIRELQQALHHAEERLRVALAAGRLGAWERDLRTGEFTASAKCKANLGLAPDAPFTFEMLQSMRHPDDSDRVAQAIRTALDTGEDYDVEYRAIKPDGTVAHIIARGHVVFENQVPVKIMGVTLDVTERERDKQALEDLERRQRLLLELNDGLRRMDDPGSIMTAAAGVLGTYLGVRRAGYAEIDGEENLIIERDWTDGITPVVTGRMRFATFGPDAVADLRRGITLVVPDVAEDPRTAAVAEAFRGVGTRALITIPLVKEERLVSILYLHQSAPRMWRDEEVALAEDVAERTWAAVERARAEAHLRVSEARFRTIAEALPALVWILGKDLKLTYVNERWIKYSGLSAEQALDYSWMEAIHPDDLARILVDRKDVARSESAYNTEVRYRSPGGEYRWHMIQAEPLHNAQGEFTGWCGASIDIHDRKVAEAALRDSADRLQVAMLAARMGNWTWDARSDRVTLPDRAAEIFGVAPDTVVTWQAMLEWLHPADADAVAAAVREASRTGGQYDVEYRIRRGGDDRPVWIAAKGQATYGPDGALTGMTGVIQDITDRKHAEERQQLLIRELHHRVKNTLATVQAIVSSTARTASNIDEFYQGFVGRIVSLAQTHNLLTDDQWQQASLEELLRNELGPYEDKGRTRVILEGPVVEFPSVAAVPIGMAIHELTTNAAKHGAFANSDGWVEVRWTVAAEPQGPFLHLTWTELGGPPVRKPERQGFGSRLLQRVLAAQLQASVEVDYDEAGIRCTIRMPLPSETALLNPIS